ncbi:MAG: hypothetical protein V1696_01055 [Candidatus Jorgensenbacteria bacterium]
MHQNQTPLYVTVIVLAFLMVGGFVLVFLELSDLKNAVSELQFTAARPVAETPLPAAPPTSSPTSTSTPPAGGPPPAPAVITIPTTIIFQTQSGPALQPRTNLTVAVESVSRAPDGTATVHLRVYTNQATGYSAFNPASSLQLIDLEGENQPPTPGTGSFGSMPPQSAAEGTVTFSTDPTRDTLILQTGSSDNPTFYEFNFAKKTYKETVIG